MNISSMKMMCYPPFFIDVKGGENIGKEQREDA